MIYPACLSKSSNLSEIEKSVLNITPNIEKSVRRTQKNFFESTAF